MQPTFRPQEKILARHAAASVPGRPTAQGVYYRDQPLWAGGTNEALVWWKGEGVLGGNEKKAFLFNGLSDLESITPFLQENGVFNSKIELISISET